MKKYPPITIGMRFGRLTVVGLGERDERRREHKWLCKCDCGSPPRLVRKSSLNYGASVSCGLSCSGRTPNTKIIKGKIISAARLREVVHYDAETGIWTWLVSIGRKARVGAVAGSIGSKGYLHIGIDGRYYSAHCLAVLWMEERWPENEVDHRDGDRQNNQWLNLREVTSSQNSMNRKRPSDNTSGFKGVVWRKQRSKWIAQIKIDGRLRYLGSFDTPEAAHVAYCEAAKLHFGEFARSA